MVKKIDTKLYVIAAVVTILIFISGFFVDFVLTGNKSDTLLNLLNKIKREQEVTQLEFLLMEEMGEKNCDVVDNGMSILTEITEKTRKNVAEYEESGRIFTSEFKDLKKQYMNLLIKNWLLFKQYKDSCKPNMTLMLYFYSNKHCDKCKDQGTVLTYLQRTDPSIVIFPLDSDLDITPLKLIKDMFNLTDPVKKPILVINREEVYRGFQPLDKIKSTIK